MHPCLHPSSERNLHVDQVHHLFSTSTFSARRRSPRQGQVRQKCRTGVLNFSPSSLGQAHPASWDGVGVGLFVCLLAALHTGASCKCSRYKQTNTQLLCRALLPGDEAFDIELADQAIGFVVGDALLLGRECSSQGTNTLVTSIPCFQRSIQLALWS
jgi:hypothetical protein